MRKVYSLSISDENIINHLDGISHKSQYIKELIKRDVEKEPFTEKQIAYIYKMIDEKLSGHTITWKMEDDRQMEETVQALDDLLNDF